MQESGLIEINLFICILVILGQYPMFSSSLGLGLTVCVCVFVCVCLVRSGYSLMAVRFQVFCSFLNALMAHQLTLESYNH